MFSGRHLAVDGGHPTDADREELGRANTWLGPFVGDVFGRNDRSDASYLHPILSMSTASPVVSHLFISFKTKKKKKKEIL